MSSPNLWWLFDPDSESFSTLPTGPFMVPALILCLFLYLSKAILEREHTYRSIAGPIAETEEWKRKKERYDELVAAFVASNGNIELHERTELNRLEKYLLDPR